METYYSFRLDGIESGYYTGQDFAWYELRRLVAAARGCFVTEVDMRAAELVTL